MKPNTKLEEVLRNIPEELKKHYSEILLSSDKEEMKIPEFWTLNNLLLLHDNEPKVSVISTGWKGIDTIAEGGIAQGEVCLLAGEAGAGKTHFAVNMAINYARQGKRVFYLTLEDGWRMIIDRFERLDPDRLLAPYIFMVKEDEITLENALPMLELAIQDSDIIIVDNLFALPLKQGGKTDFWTSQAEWVDDLANLIRSSRSSCLILHHLNKTKYGTEVDRFNIAGSTRLVNRVSQVWLLYRTQKDDCMIAIKQVKNRRSPHKGECFLKSGDTGELFGVTNVDPLLVQYVKKEFNLS